MRISSCVLVAAALAVPALSLADGAITVTGPSTSATGLSVAPDGVTKPACAPYTQSCGVASAGAVGAYGTSTAEGGVGVWGATIDGGGVQSVGVYGQSNGSGIGVYGESTGHIGVYGYSAEWVGVVAQSFANVGLMASGNVGAELSGGKYPLRLAPGTGVGAPSSGDIGAIYLDAAGALWLCTASGSPGTWVRLGPVPGSESRVYLPADVSTSSPTTYTSVFSLTVPANKYVEVEFDLIQDASQPGVGIQNRVWTPVASPFEPGSCWFQTPVNGSVEVDVLAVKNTATDTGAGGSAVGDGVNAVGLTKVHCALKKQTAAYVIELQIQADGNYTVYTRAGSSYVMRYF